MEIWWELELGLIPLPPTHPQPCMHTRTHTYSHTHTISPLTPSEREGRTKCPCVFICVCVCVCVCVYVCVSIYSNVAQSRKKEGRSCYNLPDKFCIFIFSSSTKHMLSLSHTLVLGYVWLFRNPSASTPPVSCCLSLSPLSSLPGRSTGSFAPF